MIDTIQLVLLLVIVILAVFLLVLGIQVYFILKDFRKTVKKLNRVLDNTEDITSNIAKPIDSLSTLASGFRGGGSILTAIKVIKNIIGNDDEKPKGNSI